MKLKFEKYESGGNDFVLIDDRKNNYNLTTSKIKNICSRNFGVGSDGFIVLKVLQSQILKCFIIIQMGYQVLCVAMELDVSFHFL